MLAALTHLVAATLHLWPNHEWNFLALYEDAVQYLRGRVPPPTSLNSSELTRQGRARQLAEYVRVLMARPVNIARVTGYKTLDRWLGSTAHGRDYMAMRAALGRDYVFDFKFVARLREELPEDMLAALPQIKRITAQQHGFDMCLEFADELDYTPEMQLRLLFIRTEMCVTRMFGLRFSKRDKIGYCFARIGVGLLRVMFHRSWLALAWMYSAMCRKEASAVLDACTLQPLSPACARVMARWLLRSLNIEEQGALAKDSESTRVMDHLSNERAKAILLRAGEAPLSRMLLVVPAHLAAHSPVVCNVLLADAFPHSAEVDHLTPLDPAPRPRDSRMADLVLRVALAMNSVSEKPSEDTAASGVPVQRQPTSSSLIGRKRSRSPERRQEGRRLESLAELCSS